MSKMDARLPECGGLRLDICLVLAAGPVLPICFELGADRFFVEAVKRELPLGGLDVVQTTHWDAVDRSPTACCHMGRNKAKLGTHTA